MSMKLYMYPKKEMMINDKNNNTYFLNKFHLPFSQAFVFIEIT